jgi:hypothetical protein
MGKVKFDLEPADAEIMIDGKAMHMGSPWLTELAPGTHPIEIHKGGYKSWLTSLELSPNETASLRVVLEPITSAIDATLTVATTPPGLDVYIDGALLPQKTPIKATLKVGAHKIVVKQNGLEVWQQNVNAEASSDYEFHPSFTDDKKRERAQRTTTPRPAIDKPPAGSAAAAGSTPTGTPPAGSGSTGSTPATGSAGSAGSAAPTGTTGTTPPTPTSPIAPSLEKPTRAPSKAQNLNKGAPAPADKPAAGSDSSAPEPAPAENPAPPTSGGLR